MSLATDMRTTEQTSAKAVGTLLAGLITFLTGVLAVLGTSDAVLVAALVFLSITIVLGILALRDIRRADGFLSGRGLALWGLWIGPIGLVIAGFLTPSV